MLFKQNKLITNIDLITYVTINLIESITNKSIGYIYKGTKLVFKTITNAIKSCFGGGTWFSAKPWLNTDYWKNN